MLADYIKIFDFLSEYITFLKETEKKEQEKLRVLLSNDVKKIDSVMSEYQFTIKKMQEFETRRQVIFADEKIADKKMSEVAALFDGEERKNLEKICKELVMTADNIKQYNSKSLEIADMNLKIMDELNSTGEEVTDPNCYNQKGIQNGNVRKSSVLNKQI